MQGPSHVGFALATSMCLNSAVNACFPTPLPNNWEEILHALGQPYTLIYIVAFIHHPLYIIEPGILFSVAHKLTFYLLLLLAATAPDRWERRSPRERVIGKEGTTVLGQEERGPLQSHRGFTHSLLLWMLFAALFGTVYIIFMRYLSVTHIVLTGIQIEVVEEVIALFLALLLGLFLHSIADMLTRRGVRVLWPDEHHYGFGPRSWRFKNNSWREYAVVWGMIFLTGILFAKSLVGF